MICSGEGGGSGYKMAKSGMTMSGYSDLALQYSLESSSCNKVGIYLGGKIKSKLLEPRACITLAKAAPIDISLWSISPLQYILVSSSSKQTGIVLLSEQRQQELQDLGSLLERQLQLIKEYKQHSESLIHFEDCFPMPHPIP